MKNALLATGAGTPIEVWFQDEARVGQQGSLTYIWAPIGSCPRMVRDNRHDSAYLFGAICPDRGPRLRRGRLSVPPSSCPRSTPRR
jgi:hypothetical protein